MDLSQERDGQDEPLNRLKIQPEGCPEKRKGDEASVSGTESNAKDDDSPPTETSDEDHTDGEDEDAKGDDIEVINREFQFRTKGFHIIKTRQGKKQYKCDVCTGIYQHAFSLKRHFLRTHINYKYLSEADVTNCNINLNLVKKLKAEDGDASGCPGLYRCHICTELFDTREELKSHDSSHPNSNAQKGFSCNQCEMTFPHRQNLVRHQSVHVAEKRFACKHCGKCFPSLNNQRKHEKTHEVGNASFSCPSCGVSFAEGNDLRRHCRKAHPESFHPCVSCTKFFTSPEKLAKHAQVHRPATGDASGPKKERAAQRGHIVFKKRRGKRFEPRIDYKYSCTVCKRRFATYVNMCRHKKALHPPAQNEKKTRSAHLRKEGSKTKQGKVKDLSEEEFYMTIAHRISENLLYHLDGKSSQLKIKRDQGAFPEEVGSKDDLHWSFYNFPAAFDITQMMQIYSNRNPLYNALSNDGSDNSDETDFADSLQRNARNVCKPDEVPRTFPKIFICSVCAEKFPSLQAIEDHKINNHPNVVCTHLELEGQKDVPPELCWVPKGPVGMCCQNVALTQPVSEEQRKLKCTKCESVFVSRDDLHQHILECGDNSSFNRVSRFGSLVKRSTGIVTYVRGRKRYLPLPKSPVKNPTKRLKREDPPPPPPPQPQDDEQQKEVELDEEMGELPQDGECLEQGDLVGEKENGAENNVSVIEDKEVLAEKKANLVEGKAGSVEGKTNLVEREGAEEERDVSDGNASLVEEKELIIEDGAFEVVGSTEEVVADETLKDNVTVTEIQAPTEEADAPSEDDLPTYTIKLSEVDSDPHHVDKRRQQPSESGAEALQVHDYLPVSSPGEPLGNSFHEHRDKQVEESVVEKDGFCAKEENLAAEQADDSAAANVQQPEGRILRSKSSSASVSATPFPTRKHHTCSTCKRKFAYLASLKKHLQDICPNKKVAGTQATRRRGRGKVAREPAEETENLQEGELEEPSLGCDRLGDLGVFPDEDSKVAAEEELVDALDNNAESLNQTKEAEDEGPSLSEVKVENGERGRKTSKDHCCPYCLHSFAYLSNFRKHIREVCLVMKKAMESKDTKMKLAKLRSISTCATAELPCKGKDGTSSTAVNLKGNIENSVINLLRNQSKQMEFISPPSAPKEQRTAPSSPNFMTFSCPVCHRIFLSYVKMLQHRLSHKLKTDDTVKEESSSSPHDDAALGKKADEGDETLQSRPKSEEERFDEILQTLRNQSVEEPAEPVVKKEDDVICLAELHDPPDEDEEKGEGVPTKVEREDIAEDGDVVPEEDAGDSKQEAQQADVEGGEDNYDDEEAVDGDLDAAVVTVKKLRTTDRRKKGAKAKAAPCKARQKKVPARPKGGKNKL
ncbi:uncharacterized protein LOC135369990 [Ornithodoros turicata]|uniref:uncharacterized protein LOC135369990 n=1 Tax=Ornithodoros turicata TaxID=34597 RepID=UPI003139CF26